MPTNEVGASTQDLQDWAVRIKELRERTLLEVSRVVVGMDRVAYRFLIALLAGGHVLLEGVPGVAKTTLSKTFAQILGIQYQRIQFTPDLLPSDVTGTYVLDRKTNDFVLRRGPIFCQVLLADEINRAPAKTQSALLEAMQEYQVTIEGTTLPLTPPFMVLATQNPVEQEGVYRLPEAQLDRFLLRIEMGYPGPEFERAMLKLHSQAIAPAPQVFTPDAILAMQAQTNHVFGKEELFKYIIDLAEASRRHPDVALGASPRGRCAYCAAPRLRFAGGPNLLHARGRAGDGAGRSRPSPDHSARSGDRGESRQANRARHRRKRAGANRVAPHLRCGRA